jgi:hypothetical protein
MPDERVSITLPTSATQGDPPNHDWGLAIIGATAQVLSAAAWPIAVVVLALVLRRQLTAVLGRLSHVKVGQFEAALEKEIAKLQELPDVTIPPGEAEKVKQTAEIIGEKSPIESIIRAWVEVERALEELWSIVSGATSGGVTVGAIQKRGLISTSEASEIRDLRSIRNRLVHNPDEPISAGAARLYTSRALAIAAVLRQRIAEQKQAGAG